MLAVYRVYSFTTGSDLVEASNEEEAVEKVKKRHSESLMATRPDLAQRIASMPFEEFRVSPANIIDYHEGLAAELREKVKKLRAKFAAAFPYACYDKNELLAIIKMILDEWEREVLGGASDAPQP